MVTNSSNAISFLLRRSQRVFKDADGHPFSLYEVLAGLWEVEPKTIRNIHLQKTTPRVNTALRIFDTFLGRSVIPSDEAYRLVKKFISSPGARILLGHTEEVQNQILDECLEIKLTSRTALESRSPEARQRALDQLRERALDLAPQSASPDKRFLDLASCSAVCIVLRSPGNNPDDNRIFDAIGSLLDELLPLVERIEDERAKHYSWLMRTSRFMHEYDRLEPGARAISKDLWCLRKATRVDDAIDRRLDFNKFDLLAILQKAAIGSMESTEVQDGLAPQIVELFEGTGRKAVEFFENPEYNEDPDYNYIRRHLKRKGGKR